MLDPFLQFFRTLLSFDFSSGFFPLQSLHYETSRKPSPLFGGHGRSPFLRDFFGVFGLICQNNFLL